ncbi:hypothetical protein AVEN_225198-1 [Araneus ventricosus]|uniref:Uncharacterized protein n=1 Tax=Araneus ventricosus TaxID=182803 RepID=A0A4Y2ALA3_ARAVE|nr:hypothetical protein AVEN_225198-1 [Araneus ventricosus]
MFQNTPLSTSKEAVETPSVSIEGDEDFAVSKAVVSPLKELKLAILSTLSPSASSDTKIALKSSKAKRKSVQAIGEVLTTDMVAANLHEEHEESRMKKARYSPKLWW